MSSTSGHSTSPTLPTARSVLLSAAIGYYYYLPRPCLSPHISHGRLSQISLSCSLSVITSSMLLMTSYSWQLLQARTSYIQYSARPFPAHNRRCGASRYGCGSTRRCPYQNTRAHTIVCASRRRPLLDDERTPVVSKKIGHAASRSTKNSYIQLRNFVLVLTFSTSISSEKSKKFLGNDLRVTFLPRKKRKFLGMFFGYLSRKIRDPFSSRKFLRYFQRNSSSGGRNMKTVSTYITAILHDSLQRRYLLSIYTTTIVYPTLEIRL